MPTDGAVATGQSPRAETDVDGAETDVGEVETGATEAEADTDGVATVGEVGPDVNEATPGVAEPETAVSGAAGTESVAGSVADSTDDAGFDGADDGASTAALELDGVTKQFDHETAVDGLSLRVQPGELLTMVGPSGCGKTTTLRLLAGLERPDAGAIRIDGESVAGDGGFVAAEDRDVGVVFQDFALFPHLTVRENVAFGLDGADAADRERRVDDLLDLVNLSDYGDRNPEQLSGGQQQRVALARALAPEPDALLLDEPFSNLDTGLRTTMREEVRSIIKEAGVTAVSVTHDQEEALSIGDRVAVMNAGCVDQVGSPEALFEDPKSRFVADFLGRASFLSGRVTDDGVETPLTNLPNERLRGGMDAYAGAAIDVLVRPDDLRATPDPTDPDGTVVHREYSGPSFVHRIELDNGDVVHCLHNHAECFDVGTDVRVDVVADHPLAWYPA